MVHHDDRDGHRTHARLDRRCARRRRGAQHADLPAARAAPAARRKRGGGRGRVARGGLGSPLSRRSRVRAAVPRPRGGPASARRRCSEPAEELEQGRVNSLGRLLLDPVPAPGTMSLAAQISRPAPHGLGRHETLDEVELAGQEQGRLFDAALGPGLGQLPVAIHITVPVQPAGEAGPLEGGDGDLRGPAQSSHVGPTRLAPSSSAQGRRPLAGSRERTPTSEARASAAIPGCSNQTM